MCGGNIPPPRMGEVARLSRGEKFFNIDIFRNSVSKYSKLLVKLYVCNNLNEIYHFFFIFNKNFECHLEIS